MAAVLGITAPAVAIDAMLSEVFDAVRLLGNGGV
jgi:hypothetical protein